MGDHRDLYAFMGGEALKVDGSNFARWYLRLTAMLRKRNALFVIRGHIGNPPDLTANEKEINEFRALRELYFLVANVMTLSMDRELQVQFADTRAYVIVDQLKSMFVPQFRVAKFELENEFLSTKMEEHTCLETHVTKMHGIYQSLVEDFDYWTTDEFAITTVLHSLPPSYKNFVHDYVGRGETSHFHVFMVKLRSVKVEPVAGEIIDGEGIYDIPVVNVYSLIQHLQFDKYLILVLFYENRACCCLDGTR